MSELCISAVSVRNGKIDKIYTEGPCDSSTLFQAASISKFVFTAALLRFLEERDISLDTDIVPLTEGFTLLTPEGKTAKATIRSLLTHTAGVSASGFIGYPYPAPLPSTLEILNGEGPCSTRKFVQDTEPGHWRYTGGGFMILQLFAEQQTGLVFEDFMQQYLFRPLGMTSSTFSTDAVPVAGIPYYEKPSPYGYYFMPESSAAGLVTTPYDLAQFGIHLQNILKDGSGIVSCDTAKEMTRPQCPDRFLMEDSRECMTGLGCYLKTIDGTAYFGHCGDNVGFRSIADFSLDGTHGACILINSDGPDDENRLFRLEDQLLRDAKA
ncbi:MAG: beta-lactamase family protein [Oscillospiraceae bacterium]|nr:beta-lactamase family protein [Oscillospiraceae bacterium]